MIIEKRNLSVTDTLPVESGKTAAGTEWRKQTILFTEFFQNAPSITTAATALGKTIDEIYHNKIRPGDEVDVTLAISSREWKGRWYTEAVVREIKKVWSASHGDLNPAMQKEAADNAAYKERYYAAKDDEQAADNYIQKKMEEKFGSLATGANLKGEPSDDLPF